MANFEILSIHADPTRIGVVTKFEAIVNLCSEKNYERQIYLHLVALYLTTEPFGDIVIEGNNKEGFVVFIKGENAFHINCLD